MLSRALTTTAVCLGITATSLGIAAAATAAPVAVPDMPSEQDAAIIETHASVWYVVIKREHLRALTVRWTAASANPDSAAACFAQMLPVAEGIVDDLEPTAGFSRATLMRWLENDVGLKPYFFPPQAEQLVEQKQGKGSVWKYLSPLVPLILYRVVDRVLD